MAHLFITSTVFYESENLHFYGHIIIMRVERATSLDEIHGYA